MARLCERPGCSQPADVIYGIDADHLVVWIEPLDGAQPHRAGVLCRRHADAMVVPLGWMLDDRREPVPRLFKPRESSAPAKPRSRRHRPVATRDDTGQLQLGDSAVADAAPTVPGANGNGRTNGNDRANGNGNSNANGNANGNGDPSPAGANRAADADLSASGDATAPWKPVFDQSDDLDGLLRARSPLLSRAFGKRDRPKG